MVLELESRIKRLNKLTVFLYFLLTFIFGFIVSQLILLSHISPLSYFTGQAISTPSDFIDSKDIIIYKDKVVILVNDTELRSYKITGSMLPFLGENSNGIVIVPKNENEIKIGDVITFKRNKELVVHRVVSKGSDEEGIFYVTKGDNSVLSDGRVRFDEIEYKLVGILY